MRQHSPGRIDARASAALRLARDLIRSGPRLVVREDRFVNEPGIPPLFEEGARRAVVGAASLVEPRYFLDDRFGGLATQADGLRECIALLRSRERLWDLGDLVHRLRFATAGETASGDATIDVHDLVLVNELADDGLGSLDPLHENVDVASNAEAAVALYEGHRSTPASSER